MSVYDNRDGWRVSMRNATQQEQGHLRSTPPSRPLSPTPSLATTQLSQQHSSPATNSSDNISFPSTASNHSTTPTRNTEVRGDQEFGCVRESIMLTHTNLSAPGEHIPEVERSIRTNKERVRALIYDLPYKSLPKILIESTVFNAVRLLIA